MTTDITRPEPNLGLRIAVPNKGALSDETIDMLREAGYRTRRDSKELVVRDIENDVDFFYLRPRDIAVYVGSGTVDAGLTGRDLLLDSGSEAVEIMALGFGGSTFRYAAVPGDVGAVAEIDGKRVATSYPGLVRSDLSAPLLGTAMRKPRFGSGRVMSVVMFVAVLLQVGVDVVERDALGQHEDLEMVEQLADLLRRLDGRLVLGRHPHLGGLLDDLLADLVHTGVEGRDRARTLRAGHGLVGQLGVQLLKALHGATAYGGPVEGR